MSLELIDLNSPLLLELIVTTEELRGKKNDTELGLKNQHKVITQSLGRKQSNLKLIRGQNVSSYYGKNWKVINHNNENWCIIYLAITTVMTELLNQKKK